MNEYQKFEYIHSSIQESLNGNNSMLNQALSFVEDIREKYLKGKANESK